MAPTAHMARRERRSPFGDAFMRAFADDDLDTLSFDDLVRAASGDCHYSDVVSWIARALTSGFIEEAGYASDEAGEPRGPRRYRLTEVGLTRLGQDRRRG